MAAQILQSMKEYGWPAALIGPQVTALSADFQLEELLGERLRNKNIETHFYLIISDSLFGSWALK